MADANRLLSLLRKQAGQTIKRKTLQAELEKRPPGRRSSGDSLESHLLLLSEIGLISGTERQIQVASPFTVTGRISFNKRGLAFVETAAEKDIFIAPECTGSALPGDRVEVALQNRSRERFEGRVIRVVERERQFYRLKVTSISGGKRIAGLLLDVRPALLALLGPVPAAELGGIKKDSVLIVNLTGEKKLMGHTEHYVARFLRREETEDDLERIILKHGYERTYPPLGPARLPEIEPAQVHDWKDRKDLRELWTITIDGADAKDFDDALSIEPMRDGWLLHVHIADVAYYVEQNSPLDQEARRRATSVYLPGMVLPMLPPELSEELCSLKAGVNRLAFTVAMEVRKDGSIKNYRCLRSVIQVNERLTYESADEILNQNRSDTVGGMLLSLNAMAQALRQRRIKNGRIDLDIPEVTFQKGTTPLRRPRLISSILIEEAMLSANTCVAEFLRKNKAPALYRVHAPMDTEKLELLNYFLKLHEIAPIQPDNPASLQQALATVQAQGPKPSRIFQFLLLRSFMQAVYAPDPGGHWALALKDYCHFTSPIRRYPDLVCHRALAGILKKKNRPAPEDLNLLARHTSERERKAMDAERDASKLFGLRYLAGLPEKRMRALLSGFKFDRMFFELENGLEAVVKAEHLGGGELTGPDPFSVFVPRLARPVYLGEEWELDLEEIDFENMLALFKPVYTSIPRSTEWK